MKWKRLLRSFPRKKLIFLRGRPLRSRRPTPMGLSSRNLLMTWLSINWPLNPLEDVDSRGLFYPQWLQGRETFFSIGSVRGSLEIYLLYYWRRPPQGLRGVPLGRQWHSGPRLPWGHYYSCWGILSVYTYLFILGPVDSFTIDFCMTYKVCVG